MEIFMETDDRFSKRVMEVVYIEYLDNKPHAVVTIDKEGCNTYWDCFYERGYKDDLRIYESGSGGKGIDGPQFIPKYKGGSYWKSEKIQFNTPPPLNATELARPILYTNDEITSSNPFDIGGITYSCQYCNVCERKKKGSGYSSEYCDEHTYTDDNGDLRYFNHKYVD